MSDISCIGFPNSVIRPSGRDDSGSFLGASAMTASCDGHRIAGIDGCIVSFIGGLNWTAVLNTALTSLGVRTLVGEPNAFTHGFMAGDADRDQMLCAGQVSGVWL